MMRKAVIVGTGAGGATVARELQGKFDITILESGKPVSYTHLRAHET